MDLRWTLVLLNGYVIPRERFFLEELVAGVDAGRDYTGVKVSFYPRRSELYYQINNLFVRPTDLAGNQRVSGIGTLFPFVIGVAP